MSFFVKLIGLIIIFGTCVATGTITSGKLYRNHRQSVLMGQFWGDFLREMDLSAASPKEIIKTLADRSMYREFPFAQSLAASRETFCVSLKKALIENDLPQTMQKIIQPLADTLGSVPMEAERQMLLSVLTALRQEEKYWAEQKTHQGVLYRRLGILGGLALVVLLI